MSSRPPKSDNAPYHIRPYVEKKGTPYVDRMRRVSYARILQTFVQKHSQMQKPYKTPNYQFMEYAFPPWPGPPPPPYPPILFPEGPARPITIDGDFGLCISHWSRPGGDCAEIKLGKTLEVVWLAKPLDDRDIQEISDAIVKGGHVNLTHLASEEMRLHPERFKVGFIHKSWSWKIANYKKSKGEARLLSEPKPDLTEAYVEAEGDENDEVRFLVQHSFFYGFFYRQNESAPWELKAKIRCASDLDHEQLCATCCDEPDYTAPAWDWDTSAQTIPKPSAGNTETVEVYITDGCPPFSWQVSGTGFSLQNAETTGRSNTLIADDTSCGSATITVTDNCSESCEGSVRGADGVWSSHVGNMNCPWGTEQEPTYWYQDGWNARARVTKGKWQVGWGIYRGSFSSSSNCNSRCPSLKLCGSSDSWYPCIKYSHVYGSWEMCTCDGIYTGIYCLYVADIGGYGYTHKKEWIC